MMAFFRKITHIIFPVKRAQYKFVKSFSSKIENKIILEIGAGQGYKIETFFPKSNIYVKSDLVPSEGIEKLDIVNDRITQDYDVIVCLNVLEHIYEFQKALDNIYEGLKTDGYLLLCIPLFYPLHMLPDDYWRFTPSTIERLLLKYRKVIISTNGLKHYPYNINVLAIK